MTKDEALKLALDFLLSRRMGAEELIVEIQEALAQPAQEPVAINWDAVHEKLCDVWRHDLSADEGLDEIQDLIATPPAAAKEENT